MLSLYFSQLCINWKGELNVFTFHCLLYQCYVKFVTIVLDYDFLFFSRPLLLSLSFGLLATEVVTVFVFQEPSLLSSLQDNGLTDVMLHALLIKDVSFQQSTFCAVVFCWLFFLCVFKCVSLIVFSVVLFSFMVSEYVRISYIKLLIISTVQTVEFFNYLCAELFICFGCVVIFLPLCLFQVPATREVLGSLPNVFSALCLNARGLHSFVQCQPFERLFKVLLSPDYLPAMRRRRSSDPLGELDCMCYVI